MFSLLLVAHQRGSEEETNTCSSLIFIDFCCFTSIESQLDQLPQHPAICFSSFRDATEDTSVSVRNGLALLSPWSCQCFSETIREAAALPWGGFSHIGVGIMLLARRTRQSLLHEAILAREGEQVAVLRRAALECSITLRTW